MRLTTQIHRFLISGAMLTLFGGVLATQPMNQDQFDDAVLAEESLQDLPVTIIIEKAPTAVQGRSWRQMLPASLGPRRG